MGALMIGPWRSVELDVRCPKSSSTRVTIGFPTWCHHAKRRRMDAPVAGFRHGLGISVRCPWLISAPMTPGRRFTNRPTDTPLPSTPWIPSWPSSRPAWGITNRPTHQYPRPSGYSNGRGSEVGAPKIVRGDTVSILWSIDTFESILQYFVSILSYPIFVSIDTVSLYRYAN